MFNPLSVLNNYGKRISTHKRDYNELQNYHALHLKMESVFVLFVYFATAFVLKLISA